MGSIRPHISRNSWLCWLTCHQSYCQWMNKWPTDTKNNKNPMHLTGWELYMTFLCFESILTITLDSIVAPYGEPISLDFHCFKALNNESWQLDFFTMPQWLHMPHQIWNLQFGHDRIHCPNSELILTGNSNVQPKLPYKVLSPHRWYVKLQRKMLPITYLISFWPWR